MKPGSPLSFFCKQEKGDGQDDDPDEKQKNEGKYENEQCDDDFGHLPPS